MMRDLVTAIFGVFFSWLGLLLVVVMLLPKVLDKIPGIIRTRTFPKLNMIELSEIGQVFRTSERYRRDEALARPGPHGSHLTGLTAGESYGRQ